MAMTYPNSTNKNSTVKGPPVKKVPAYQAKEEALKEQGISMTMGKGNPSQNKPRASIAKSSHFSAATVS